MVAYIALLQKDGAAHYHVRFPDFPACRARARSLETAREVAARTLAEACEDWRAEGRPLPPPSTFESLMALPGNAAALAITVPYEKAETNATQVSVLMPPDLVRRIDMVTPHRSRFFAEAALRYLAKVTPAV
jgi:predicted RNase H-like HicB family nuclease